MTKCEPEAQEILEYIAESPAAEHGGFDDRTIRAAHWAVEKLAAARAEVERLRKVETYHRDTIGRCNEHIQDQEQEIELLQSKLFECLQLLSTAEDAWECGAWNSLIAMQQLYLTRDWSEAARKVTNEYDD